MTLGESQIVVEAVRQAPAVLWFLLGVAALVMLAPHLRELLPRVESVTLPGGFAAQLGPAIAAAGAARNVVVSSTAKTCLERRAERERPVLQGARILWVDDHPENNAAEIEALESLGTEVTTVVSNSEAWDQIAERGYDLVLSDIHRDSEESGLGLAEELHAARHSMPVVYYTGRVDPDKPKPKHSFAITDRPDELVHLAIDGLARHNH